MAHLHLNYLKRCQILALWKAGYNQSQIAKEVGVHKSTICREFKRNITFVRTALGYWTYKPDYAQSYANERRKQTRYFYKFTKEVAEFVKEKILDDWSSEQISGYAKRLNLFSISHERIYQFVLEDKHNGGELYKHLRHQQKRYRKRYGSPKRHCSIKNRLMIDERPAIIDEKSRIGDWEVDTIIGKNRKHEEISKEIEADFYFAHPYSSWERGLNENTNGLVRQYIRKGSCFSNISNKVLSSIMNKLNIRPRKQLMYMTPVEIFALKKS